ncbi:hypothetical protein HKX05_20495 [Sphingomonas sanguinis]|uniref:50S ribosome-binding GTPase n=2 Tax=Sphingomonas TaxID=13687 RepID=A0A7Y7QX38_9SPHN|nr:50S ribosome-binding GTPase [Roseomonas aeriglobus]MCH8995058.1 50S ribosome-binding GTPase [Chloroflexota bacterium]NNG55713.1 hypothetical protein [Sphingomonas sanguinis]NNG59452.1 hypothetical protein [Sphingomonas paucimobilis]NVP32300.1 50S ribosome-binding GTPase [Sphingomonas sanguinis]
MPKAHPWIGNPVLRIAGTTRDRIEAPVERGGLAWVFTDTAGRTDTSDPIEAIGVERARESMAAADLVLWLGDDPPPASGMIAVHARADDPDRTHVPKTFTRQSLPAIR